MRHLTLLLAALTLALTAGACGSDDATGPADGSATPTADPTAAGGAGPLTGTFTLAAGECADAGVTSGSYFRMVQSDGTVEEGPYVQNGDSPCGDTTWVPLSPGTDGGLVTGTFQPDPEPAFGDGGHALAGAIAAPATWFAVDFAVSTNPTDPQTGTAVDAPRIEHDGDGGLSGNLAGFAAAWNGQHFNQGAPKPGGGLPGRTTPVTGTYDPDTGAFTLEWTSQVEGGPFDGFAGVWHLEGTFEPDS